MDKKQEYEYKYIHKPAKSINNGEYSTIADWLNYYAKVRNIQKRKVLL